jgi:DNA helicase II / ATP-dependent DNA helicase PcrA
MITPDLVQGLNDEQRAAVTHGDSPLLIVAGAGTGKTRTLVHRVAHLIHRGVRPDRILLLTFTRRAAEEMLARVERLVGPGGRQVQGGTFHATAHQLLRRHGEQAGIPAGFTIMDQGDSEDLMQLSRAALGFATKERRFPRKDTLQSIYSRHINTDRAVEAILADDYPQFTEELAHIGSVFADYVQRKSDRNLVDYDDLLLFWAAMLEVEPLGEQIRGRYEHVLVDEYQDTNHLQSRILTLLCGGHKRVTVVGDDAQSIYAFRGADVRNILEFPGQFAGTTQVTLDRNYRSTQPILDVANAVLAGATHGYRKVLRSGTPDVVRPRLVSLPDEPAQSTYLCDEILGLVESDGLALRDIAVLVRAGYMSADLEIALASRRIPFEKWGGIRFLEAAHIKDLLAFLRVSENQRDEVSWFRLLQLLPGVGEVSARRAMAALDAAGWQHTALHTWTAPPRAVPTRDQLVRVLNSLAAASGADAPADIVRVRSIYDELLRLRYDDADVRRNDLDQLERIAATYTSRATFLSALALDPPSATTDLAGGERSAEDDALVISTIHSAKGKEWEAVFLPWMADGWLPMARAARSADELEEERRLLYVAVTRARRHLTLLHPITTPTRGAWGADYAIDQRSRFLDERVMAALEPLTPPRAVQSPDAASGGPPVVDVRAGLRARFGQR